MRKLIKWNRKELLKDLAKDRKQNRLSNLKFIDIHVAWLKRVSNKEWSKRQKIIIDDVHKTNRHINLNSKRH